LMFEPLFLIKTNRQTPKHMQEVHAAYLRTPKNRNAAATYVNIPGEALASHG